MHGGGNPNHGWGEMLERHRTVRWAKTSSSPKRLIVFARYPTPGKAKTRLIPALGPQGAADLQRRMTEHVLERVGEFARGRHISVEVHHDGGSTRLMNYWLGREFRYRRQGKGDIGARMAHCFRETFADGTERAVLIGTDCPGITPDIVHDAFDSLDRNDVVVGPANDGGYYLIGLRRPVPELFVGIPWGTDAVIKDTLLTAKKLALSIHLVKTLGDVDNPEDLPIWEREAPSQTNHHAGHISVIIPTLNEASCLAGTLAKIWNAEDVETLIVDGGSTDRTVEIAKSCSVKVIAAKRGRATQMNKGAAAASGGILLFLHADTHLPNGFADYARRILARPEIAAGSFKLQINGAMPGLRLIERAANWRSKTLQLPYGDQALFLKTSLFRAMGGFPDIPIMEDLEFVRRLRKRGRIAIAPVPAVTSARRWLALGLWRTTLMNQCALAAYYAGVSLPTIAEWYHRKKGTQVDIKDAKPDL